MKVLGQVCPSWVRRTPLPGPVPQSREATPSGGASGLANGPASEPSAPPRAASRAQRQDRAQVTVARQPGLLSSAPCQSHVAPDRWPSDLHASLSPRPPEARGPSPAPCRVPRPPPPCRVLRISLFARAFFKKTVVKYDATDSPLSVQLRDINSHCWATSPPAMLGTLHLPRLELGPHETPAHVALPLTRRPAVSVGSAPGTSRARDLPDASLCGRFSSLRKTPRASQASWPAPVLPSPRGLSNAPRTGMRSAEPLIR